MDGRGGAPVQIIPVHGDIQGADRDGQFPEVREEAAQTERELVAHQRDAHQHHLRAGLIAFGDFVRDPREGALQGSSVEENSGFRHEEGG